MNSPLNRSTRIMAALVLVLSCIGCDQVTKSVARDRLRDEGRISLLSDTIRIEYVENEGAFLGLAAGASPRTRFVLLTVMTGALLAVVAWMLMRQKPMDAPAAAALALVLGGGLGNWIDRIAREGRVVDFLNAESPQPKEGGSAAFRGGGRATSFRLRILTARQDPEALKLNAGLGSVRTGIFNVADMAITAGVVLLFLSGSARRDGARELQEARDGSR